jgi:hypothetical protein
MISPSLKYYKLIKNIMFLFHFKVNVFYMTKGDMPKYVKGELIAKLNNKAMKEISKTISKTKDKLVTPRFGIKDLDNVLDQLKIYKISKIGDDVFLLHAPPDTDLYKAKEKLFNTKYLNNIDFNYLRYTM